MHQRSDNFHMGLSELNYPLLNPPVIKSASFLSEHAITLPSSPPVSVRSHSTASVTKDLTTGLLAVAQAVSRVVYWPSWGRPARTGRLRIHSCCLPLRRSGLLSSPFHTVTYFRLPPYYPDVDFSLVSASTPTLMQF